MKPNEEKPLGCNKNLGRGSCGDISFANKIILCDDCVWELIEENQKLKQREAYGNEINEERIKQRDAEIRGLKNE